MQQIARMCSILILIVLTGSLCIMLTEHLSFVDALYFSLTTITTVGYGDLVPGSGLGRLTSMLMMIAGVGTSLYIFSAVMAFLVEGRLKQAMGERKMKRLIAKMENHYIICGYGRLGQMVARDLEIAKEDFVLIESDPVKANAAREREYRVIEGDATHREVLEEAGVENCAGLATTISTDAENLYIGITARSLRAQLPIVCRSSSDRVRALFRRAGIRRTISTDEIGSRRLVTSLIHPHVVEFVDELLTHKEGTSTLHGVQVEAGAPVVGQTIQGAQLKDKFNVVVMTIQRDGSFLANPGPNEVIAENDILILLGRAKEIANLAALFEPDEKDAPLVGS